MLAPGKNPYDNMASQTISPQANDGNHAHNQSDSASEKITRIAENQHVQVSHLKQLNLSQNF